MKRTPVFDDHVKLGAKVVEFGGWEMPVRYTGFTEEHVAVRTKAGLFDVSHMGEFWVTGTQAEAALNYLLCNDVKKLTDGKAQYSAVLNEQGGVVDDVIVYRFSAERYLICVNAANIDVDFAWLTSKNKTDAKIEDVSPAFGQIALQGPKAEMILGQLVKTEDLHSLKPFHFIERDIGGVVSIIARTGYTGEDGFEIFTTADDIAKLWNLLLTVGAQHGLIPCGLGARDTLRLEACLPLHGHELGQEISALQSGLGWIIKFDKGDFIGKDALLKEREAGIERHLVAFNISDPGIARHGDAILNAVGENIGVVTSGSKTPTVNQSLGMALVANGEEVIGNALQFSVRDKKLKGTVIKKPIYQRGRV